MRTRPATADEMVQYVKRKVREAQFEKDALRSKYRMALVSRELFLTRVHGLAVKIATFQQMLDYSQRGELE